MPALGARRLGPAGWLLAAGATATLIAWWVLDSGGGSPAGLPPVGAACPANHPRLTIEDIRSGTFKPYLLGGLTDRPGCASCNRTDGWALPCQFKNGPLCSREAVQALLHSWLDRGYELALTLTPCDLWQYIEGRTLYFMGDSMMLDLFKASTCFLFEMWPDLEHTPLVPDDPELQSGLSTILPASCARMLLGTRICYIRVDKGQTMTDAALLLLPRVAAPTDLLVVNFGLHHGNEEDYGAALRGFTAHYSSHLQALPRLLWQQTAQQHFPSVLGNGEYSGGQPPFQCAKIEGFTVVGDGLLHMEPGRQDPSHILQGGWRNKQADEVMRQEGIPILGSFNETLPLDGMHRDNGAGHECTHFCHPSAPQTWVVALYRALRDL